jgi:hypothetical protein
MDMTLDSAIAALRSTSDQTHKFWGYYQAVTAAAVGAAWASSEHPPHVIIGLVVAYFLFALGNFRLVVSSQAAARKTWEAIQDYKKAPPVPISLKFKELLSLNKPDRPGFTGGVHLLLSLAASAAMLLRLWLGPYQCPRYFI